MNYQSKGREYAYFLSFSSFIGTFFFLGVYFNLLRTLWLSILLGGVILWLFLTLLIRISRPVQLPSLLQRLLALTAIAYGGFALYAFFEFCDQRIFPGQSFLFFPICFITCTMFSAENKIHTLERTAKFTTVGVSILLILTVISMVQKLWDERDFVMETWKDLIPVTPDSFLIQTVIVTVVLLAQTLVLLAILEESEDRSMFLRSIRRSLIPSIGLSSLLHLISVVSLGAWSFEALTYPIYDMLSLPGYAEYLDRTELLMLIIALFCESIKTIAFFRAGRTLFTGQSQG